MNSNLTSIQKIWINKLNYVDKNRPKRELKNCKVIRANMVPIKKRRVNASLHEANNREVQRFIKRVEKLVKSAGNSKVRCSEDYLNLMLSINAIDDRLDELVVETRESLNPDISRGDIWRFDVDLKSLEEKVKVMQSTKNFYLI